MLFPLLFLFFPPNRFETDTNVVASKFDLSPNYYDHSAINITHTISSSHTFSTESEVLGYLDGFLSSTHSASLHEPKMNIINCLPSRSVTSGRYAALNFCCSSSW